MSIPDRLSGGGSAVGARCCDAQIKAVDVGEAAERSPDERVDRTED